MYHNKIQEVLEKYDFKYEMSEKSFIIILDYAHIVIIDLSVKEKIIIKDELSNWNFLTGSLKMSLKKAMIYNFAGIVIFGFLVLYGETVMNFNFLSLYILFSTWILLFTSYYLIKLENFKSFIIRCTNEE